MDSSMSVCYLDSGMRCVGQWMLSGEVEVCKWDSETTSLLEDDGSFGNEVIVD